MRCLTLALTIASSPAWADATSDQLDAMGPRADWSDEAARILGAAFDADKSGRIDTEAEVQGMSCDAWQALDRNVRRDWDGTSVRVIYGFEASYIWVGDAFEMDEPLRVSLDARAATCGVTTETVNPNGDAEQRVQGAPSQGDLFDAEVRSALLAHFDRNGSGLLDSATELASVPCKVWTAVELGVRAQWEGTGLRQVYGIKPDAGLIWVGDAIGVPVAEQVTFDRMLVQCDIDNAAGSASGNGSMVSSGSVPVDEIPDHIRSAGGSESFDDIVAQDLLGSFDLNGSGEIDSGKELKLIKCPVWLAIDDGVKQQWSSGARSIYGFKKGFIWVGYAFGLNEKLRKSADKAMAACGLE